MAQHFSRRLMVRSIAALGACTAFDAFAQDTIASIYEAAKKEGKVTFFSSNDVKPNQESAKRFAKRFPGIEVEAFKIEPPSNASSARPLQAGSRPTWSTRPSPIRPC